LLKQINQHRISIFEKKTKNLMRNWYCFRKIRHLSENEKIFFDTFLFVWIRHCSIIYISFSYTFRWAFSKSNLRWSQSCPMAFAQLICICHFQCIVFQMKNFFEQTNKNNYRRETNHFTELQNKKLLIFFIQMICFAFGICN